MQNIESFLYPLPAAQKDPVGEAFEQLIATVKEHEQERIINILGSLSHLIEPSTVNYLASIIRGANYDSH